MTGLIDGVKRQAGGQGQKMSKKRVLLVDDEDDIREVARVSLEMVGGFEVVTASCGTEAIEMARQERPDAILLDVMMPDMDGPTTYGKLQDEASLKDIPVVFLTAKVQATDNQQFDEIGVAGVIAKPFDPMKLSEQLGYVLGWG